MTAPNVLFVFADQWRKQALGFEGDPNVKTPHLDRFAKESLHVANAISSTPVCTPYRASFLTGQRPLTHGLFLNDAHLECQGPSIAEAFKSSGYDTAYIGKWHVNGRGRSNYIPPEDRLGFDFWKVLECTHTYNQSAYYDQDIPQSTLWEGYDAKAQTDAMCQYIKNRSTKQPFFAALSWGPPHNPYEAAPKAFKDLYQKDDIMLRDNVPPNLEGQARNDLAGYYAHCSALDECFQQLLDTLDQMHLKDNTIVVFTSDHGDMLCSQGFNRKQRPYAESIRVPFLLRFPEKFGAQSRRIEGYLDACDIMPTLLGLCGLGVPTSVDGRDFSEHFEGGIDPSQGYGLIACYHPFGEYCRQKGGEEYRGLVSNEYTYCETLEGGWLLFNEKEDPYQTKNLISDPQYEEVAKDLHQQLHAQLQKHHDAFKPGTDLINDWNYIVNEKGTIDYY